MSLDRFKKDMEIVKESLRLAYGPWTRKERFWMKFADVFEIVGGLCLLIGLVSIPFIIYILCQS